jgi:hypothetical protein
MHDTTANHECSLRGMLVHQILELTLHVVGCHLPIVTTENRVRSQGLLLYTAHFLHNDVHDAATQELIVSTLTHVIPQVDVSVMGCCTAMLYMKVVSLPAGNQGDLEIYKLYLR